MITILSDLQRTYQEGSTQFVSVVDQLQEYIPLRQWLRRALDDPDRDYTVYVQRQLLVKWLEDLRSYSSRVVLWKDLSLRDGFEQKFGIVPPAALDDAAIKELGLLNLDPPSQNDGMEAIGWILKCLLSPVWRADVPYPGHIASLAAWAAGYQTSHKALLELMRQRLTQWKDHDDRYLFFLTEPLAAAGEAVLLRWGLRNYPDGFSLTETQSRAPMVDCQQHRQSVALAMDKHHDELGRFWRLWLAQHPDGVLQAINGMSGTSQVEVNILISWLQENRLEPSSDLIDAVRFKFAEMRELEPNLRRLRALVSPSVPQSPEAEWTSDQWLAWATTEYMPYFAWVIRQRQPRHRQIDLADKYADWLVNSYAGLMFAQNPIFVTAQQSYVNDLFATKQVDVLFWFIIDGLTWWQGQRLMELYSESGLGIVELGPQLSALPSVTSVSKRALANGYFETSQQNLPIANMLHDRLARQAVGSRVHTQVGDFEADVADELSPGVFALLYNALDRQSHDSRHFSADESIDGHLKLIVRLTNSGFRQCLRQGLRARAIISSDHGSTLLPENATVLNIPNYALLLDDSELDRPFSPANTYQRSRACGVERELTDRDMEQLESDWYLLRSEVYNLPQHFLVPKGYAAVKRRPVGWTHGGATPEETIVPFFEIQTQPLEVLSPLVKIEGPLRAAQSSTIRITVVNPNLSPMNGVRFKMADFPDMIEWPTLKPNVPYVAETGVPAATSKSDTQPVEWLLTGDISGQHRQFVGLESIPVRRFQQSAVDELFEDM